MKNCLDNKIYKIGTRGSLLALTQAKLGMDHISKNYTNFKYEIIIVETTGDRINNIPLCDIGGKALFTKELDKKLLNCEVDIVVHSMKDVEANFNQDLNFACVLERSDPRDVLVSSQYNNLNDMPSGSIVGTCSPRRIAQLSLMRSDLKFIPLRGNIDTRIAKITKKEFGIDAVVLAAAGLKRINMDNHIKQFFSYDEIVPSSCQGIIGIQTRSNDNLLNDMLAKITHQETHCQFTLERSFVDRMNANCHTAMGSISTIENCDLNSNTNNKIIKAKFIVFGKDNKLIDKIQLSGDITDAFNLGKKAAENFLLMS